VIVKQYERALIIIIIIIIIHNFSMMYNDSKQSLKIFTIIINTVMHSPALQISLSLSLGTLTHVTCLHICPLLINMLTALHG